MTQYESTTRAIVGEVNDDIRGFIRCNKAGDELGKLVAMSAILTARNIAARCGLYTLHDAIQQRINKIDSGKNPRLIHIQSLASGGVPVFYP